MRSISCLVLPIPDHVFFEQTVFERQFSHDLFQCAGLATQVLHLVRGCCAGRIAGEPLLPGLKEVFRPAVIQILDDPSRRHSSAMLSSPRRPSRTMRIFSSAENCRRVARRMSFTTFSAGSFTGPDFCLIFAP